MDTFLLVLTVTAFIFSVISLIFSYYSWNNPKSDDFVGVRQHSDESDDKLIVYRVEKNKKNYRVIRIDLNKADEGKPHRHIADRGNNENVDFAELDSLKKVVELNYRDL